MIIKDLSGKWDVFLDTEKRMLSPETFPDSIILPDSTSNAGLGPVNDEVEYGCLTDMHKFDGYAWFRKNIDITPDMQGKVITLFLERTRMTAVYIDGRECRFGDSLCTPHRFQLGGLSVGQHELIIRVANCDYPTGGGHMTSRDTQTNWNGILGRIELQSYTACPESIRLIPDIHNKTLSVTADVIGRDSGTAKLRVYDDSREYGNIIVDYSDGAIDTVLSLSDDIPLWDEYSPTVLKLAISIGEDVKVITFGMREMKGDGLKLLVNDREVFLRGKHDGMVFPKTGYAPTDTESWLEVFRTAKQYGINHYRFHTCCPPEAAFEAADIMGIYMQPELPFWGTIPDEFGPEHEYLRAEGFRILREFGHHPSFVMMSMGNELWGSKERLNELIAGYRAVCPDKMYVGGSNNYQFVPCVLDEDDFFSGVRFDRDRLIRGSYAMCDAPQGHIQTNEPNTIHNYDPLINENMAMESRGGGEIMIQYGTEMRKVSADDSGVLVPDVPVISHEVGQFAMYPDFSEIERYCGPVRHLAYDTYKKGLEEKGLYSKWQDFFRASGKLSVQCSRNDIETALRSEQMSGFQLLDIQDFPGQGVATVGILNSFLENKGHVSPEEWRSFCSDTVVLAGLERFVYTAGDTVSCGLMISSVDPKLAADAVLWQVEVNEKVIAGGRSEVVKRGSRVSLCRTVQFAVESEKPVTARLTLKLEGTEITNSYELYIYPDIDIKITESTIEYNGKTVAITHDRDEAVREKSLYIPVRAEDDLAGEYCTDFWCYGMFRSISESMGRPVPTGTLGLLIEESPLLEGFPSEYYTTPRWFNIVSHSHCADLDGTDIIPDVWVIDNPERRKKLALLYRDNGIVCCTSRLWEIADKPEVKHFAASVVKYITEKT